MGKNKPTFEADDWQDFMDNGFLGRLVSSLFKRYLGTGLTGAEKEANAFTAEQNARAMAFSANEAEKNRAFQAEQAETQWQRGVADMRSAGLNPALAYGQGGASAMSGSVGQGSAGSSVSPAAGSFSDLLELVTLKKRMKLMDAEVEERLASAEERKASAAEKRVNAEWLPKKFASDIDVNTQAAAHYVAGISKLNAETAGINLAIEWNPKLWQNELDNGRVNRAYTNAAIREINERITNLRADTANKEADTGLKYLQQGLVAAQAALTRSQDREMSAKAWRAEFENAFTELYGYKPDGPIWNAVTSVLGHSIGSTKNHLGAFSIDSAEFDKFLLDFGSRIKTAGQNIKSNFQAKFGGYLGD